MRMDAVRARGLVLEDHLDFVADFGMNDRTENPKIFVARRSTLERLERSVGVLAVNRFAIGAADMVRVVRRIRALHLVERPAGHLIDPAWSVVPRDLVGRNVVRSDGSVSQSHGRLRDTKRNDCNGDPKIAHIDALLLPKRICKAPLSSFLAKRV